MVIKFVGYDYEYLVFKERLKNKIYYFSIMAMCRETGRYSHINNLSTILSEFAIDPDSRRAEDSEWSSTCKKVNAWMKAAEELLTNMTYLPYLEKHLDEDRECGEWENSIVFQKKEAQEK